MKDFVKETVELVEAENNRTLKAALTIFTVIKIGKTIHSVVTN